MDIEEGDMQCWRLLAVVVLMEKMMARKRVTG
jgi:hypothetical protein